MGYTETVLRAIRGETVAVRHYFYDDDNNPIPVHSGVTFQDDVYDNDHHLATYEHADFDLTGAPNGYIDILIACPAPGTWKLMTTSTFTGTGVVKKALAFLEVDPEGPPIVTAILDGLLPDLRISATESR